MSWMSKISKGPHGYQVYAGAGTNSSDTEPKIHVRCMPTAQSVKDAVEQWEEGLKR